MVVFFEEFCPSNKGVEIIVLSVVYGAYNTGLREPHEITETVFENRFMHVQELNRLRVPIKRHGRERNCLMEQRICNREFARGSRYGDGFACLLFLL